MIYNDHGILPSEIVQALSGAYKEKENSNKKLRVEHIESFLHHSQLALQSLQTLKYHGELKGEIAALIDKIKSVQYNVSTLYKIESMPVNETLTNLFSMLDSICQGIGELVQIMHLAKANEFSALMGYVCNLLSSLSKIHSALSKKDIAIRQYL